jgi:putative transposase
VKVELSIILTDECKELKLEMLALEIMPDHLHLFVGAKPTHIPCVIAKQLKGASAFKLRERFPDLVYLGYPQRWKQFPASVGTWILLRQCRTCQSDAVKRYILEQEGKDVFDYRIYGDHTSQTKIGDFTK